MKKLLLTICLVVAAPLLSQAQRWSVDKANVWSSEQGWRIGVNYIPANAINQIEMWQAETFSPDVIDKELGAAEQIGVTTIRVFLHDLVWEADPNGYASRIDLFLKIAATHHIRPMLVLFDSCWDPHPHLGLQKVPNPGVHNSGWVQSPGLDAMSDTKRLKSYVKGVIGQFANDSRILAWDIWNEPDEINLESYNESPLKRRAVEKLLPQAFLWARSVNPQQPLTSGIFTQNWKSESHLTPVERIQIAQSDFISFHSYSPADQFEAEIKALKKYGRPIFCTEYMARGLNSKVQTILPIANAYGVSAYNWGLVSGKTKTIYPWDSWLHPYSQEPKLWFHDLLYPDLRPYDLSEIEVMKQLRNK